MHDLQRVNSIPKLRNSQFYFRVGPEIPSCSMKRHCDIFPTTNTIFRWSVVLPCLQGPYQPCKSPSTPSTRIVWRCHMLTCRHLVFVTSSYIHVYVYIPWYISFERLTNLIPNRPFLLPRWFVSMRQHSNRIDISRFGSYVRPGRSFLINGFRHLATKCGAMYALSAISALRFPWTGFCYVLGLHYVCDHSVLLIEQGLNTGQGITCTMVVGLRDNI